LDYTPNSAWTKTGLLIQRRISMREENARRWNAHRLPASLVAVALACALGFAGGLALGQEQKPKQESSPLPDLVGALKATPGVLGVELARTASGKQAIFAWFENKQAVVRWYNNDVHQQAMKMLIGDHKPDPPLQGVPDDVGPVMAIASLTPSEKPEFEGVSMRISQISIELYKPISGGIFLAGRFAPASLKVPGMRDYTPQGIKRSPENEGHK
jgi:hypothetical protein